MPVKVKVKSNDPAVRTQRAAAAQRVLDQFANRLPDMKLLAFFDDEDWEGLKEEHGIANRGLYTPIMKGKVSFTTWPEYVTSLILADDDVSTLLPMLIFDHLIYVHGSICSDGTGLTMTFAHELQHFVQYGYQRKLWAANFLLPRLPDYVIRATRLRWFDFPNEREARIVAKRIAETLCGADKVRQYIDRKISERVTLEDVEDWEFIKRIDSSTEYDLAQETRNNFSRMKRYRPYFQKVLDKFRGDADFKDLDLDAL